MLFVIDIIFVFNFKCDWLVFMFYLLKVVIFYKGFLNGCICIFEIKNIK